MGARLATAKLDMAQAGYASRKALAPLPLPRILVRRSTSALLLDAPCCTPRIFLAHVRPCRCFLPAAASAGARIGIAVGLVGGGFWITSWRSLRCFSWPCSTCWRPAPSSSLRIRGNGAICRMLIVRRSCRILVRAWASVPGMRVTDDPLTLKKTYLEDPLQIVPFGFFQRGEPYLFWGLIPAERHFVGIRTSRSSAAAGPHPNFYFLGADEYGRDIFSRLIYGSRISLSVGLVAIAVTFLLGVTIGGISGYCGGGIDPLIQRVIEIVNAFPQIPLWLAFGYALPADWPPLFTYFAITIVLSLLGWTGLARVVRGKFSRCGRRIMPRRRGCWARVMAAFCFVTSCLALRATSSSC